MGRPRWKWLPCCLALSACGAGPDFFPADGPDAAASADDGGSVRVQVCAQVPGEIEPNEDAGDATPLSLGTTVAACLASGDDTDVYEFVVPSDPGGGFVQVALTEVGDGQLGADILSATDGGKVASYFALSRGQSLNLFAATAPHQRYRLVVHDFTGFSRSYVYKVRVSYAKVDDKFEPNDRRSEARPIVAANAKGVFPTVTGFLFAGFTAGQTVAAEAYDDFYKIDLKAGASTWRLDDVPDDVAPDLQLLDENGSELARRFDLTPGASLVLKTTLTAAGTYYVKAGVFAPVPAAEGKGIPLPDHFTRPYRLAVSQP